ncbi:MAG: hypothetical protein ACYTXC_11405 [Nostoc sp.]
MLLPEGAGVRHGVAIAISGDITLKTARNKVYDVVPCRFNIYGFLQRILK